MTEHTPNPRRLLDEAANEIVAAMNAVGEKVGEGIAQIGGNAERAAINTDNLLDKLDNVGRQYLSIINETNRLGDRMDTSFRDQVRLLDRQIEGAAKSLAEASTNRASATDRQLMELANAVEKLAEAVEAAVRPTEGSEELVLGFLSGLAKGMGIEVPSTLTAPSSPAPAASTPKLSVPPTAPSPEPPEGVEDAEFEEVPPTLETVPEEKTSTEPQKEPA